MRNELERYLPVLPEYYYDAFRLLHVYENKLRIFVIALLKGHLGAAWKSCVIRGDSSLLNIMETRMGQQKQYGHISAPSVMPMDYLTMDELVGIITNDPTKKYFVPHFPASIEKVYKSKFWEILVTRNHLMHFRPIDEKDADRLGHNILDTVPIIDSIIQEFTSLYWPEDLFENDQRGPEQPMRNNWLPIMMKKRAVGVKIAETPSKKWIKVYLLFPHILKHENDDFGIHIESYRIVFASVVDLLTDLFSKAVYFNKFDCPSNDLSASPPDNDIHAAERIRGLEICFLKQTFDAEEDLIRSSIINMLDEIEKWYSNILEEKDRVDSQQLILKFKKHEDYLTGYVGGMEHQVGLELKELVNSDDWTNILEGNAFESIIRDDKRYSMDYQG